MKPIAASTDPRHVFSAVPFMQMLGVRRELSAGGKARLVLEARPELGNVIGAVHGGVIVTLLDVVMASAAVSIRNFEVTAVTLNLDSSFIGPGRGTLTADGELTARDDSLAWCTARVCDADGSLVAMSHGCFRYLPLPT